MENDGDLHQLLVSLDVSVDPIPKTSLHQTSIYRIQHLLERHPDLKQVWSTRPRTYALFRMVKSKTKNTELCAFIEQKLHDILLPLPINQLPEATKKNFELRDHFLRLQLLVLSNPETIVPPSGESAGQAIIEKHSHIDDGDAFFNTKRRLGPGGSESVDSVVCKLTGIEYARKKIRRPTNITLSDQETLIEFKQELAALKRLSNHPHLVQYIASYTDYKSVAFIMTPIADCDLRGFLEAFAPNQDRIAERELLLGFFGCLATATKTLHDRQIRHMNIKPTNILIKDGTVLFCDFGISRDWSGTAGDTTQGPICKKTIDYCSPEVDDGEERNKASDIFSLGVVYLEMTSVLGGSTIDTMRTFLKSNGDTAVPCWNISGVFRWIEELRESGTEEETVPLQWIGQMISKDPKERISAEDLVETIQRHSSQTHFGQFTGSCCRPSYGSQMSHRSSSTWIDSPRIMHDNLPSTRNSSRNPSLPSPRIPEQQAGRAAVTAPILEPDVSLQLPVRGHHNSSQTPPGEQIYEKPLNSWSNINNQLSDDLLCKPCKLEIYETMAPAIWDCTRTIFLVGDVRRTSSSQSVSYQIPLFGLQIFENNTDITISWREFYRSGVETNDTQVQKRYQTVGIVLSFITNKDAKGFMDIVSSLPKHPLLSMLPTEPRALDAVRVRVYKVYTGPKLDTVAHRILMVSRGTLSGNLDIVSYILSKNIGLTIQLLTGTVMVQLDDLRVPLFVSRRSDSSPPTPQTYFEQSKVGLTFAYEPSTFDTAGSEGGVRSFLSSITGWQLIYIGSAHYLKDSGFGLRNSKNKTAVIVTIWRPISQLSEKIQILLSTPLQSDSKKWTSGTLLTSTAISNQKEDIITLKLSKLGRGKHIDVAHMCAGSAECRERAGELKLRFSSSKELERMARILVRLK